MRSDTVGDFLCAITARYISVLCADKLSGPRSAQLTAVIGLDRKGGTQTRRADYDRKPYNVC